MAKNNKKEASSEVVEEVQAQPQLEKYSVSSFIRLTNIESRLEKWAHTKYDSLGVKTGQEWALIFIEEGVLSEIPTIFR